MQLKADQVSFRYRKKEPWILRNVSFELREGERVGIIGPSGYGKSTLSKLLAGYEKPTEGKILLDGVPLSEQGFCPVQMIAQHPELSVNPRWKMKQILCECWNPPQSLLDQIGIEPAWFQRWPAELSGGELQRFCIARVLAPQTKFLICDEITTMLDVITQAQIWQTLVQIAEVRQMGMIVITHNQALAEKVCTRIVDLQEINQV